MQQYSKNLILGGGIAGLVAAEVLSCHNFHIVQEEGAAQDNSTIKTIGGQMANEWPLGPRVLHFSERMEDFLKLIGFKEEEIFMKIFKVGYKVEDEVLPVAPEGFREAYIKKTRPHAIADSKSYMSEGLNEFVGFVDPNIQDITRRLHERASNREVFIRSRVFSVDPIQKWISINKCLIEYLRYEKLISTIPLNKLLEMTANFHLGDSHRFAHYEDKTRNFEITEKILLYARFKSAALESMRSKCDYFYSATDPYTRVTFDPKYGENIIIETDYISYLPDIMNDKFLGIEKLLDQKHIPVQIQRNLSLKTLNGIWLVGRFAQWDHDILTTDVLDRALELRRGWE
jgi:hypothetical protein